jgi:hypothetical protein
LIGEVVFFPVYRASTANNITADAFYIDARPKLGIAVPERPGRYKVAVLTSRRRAESRGRGQLAELVLELRNRLQPRFAILDVDIDDDQNAIL